MNYKPFDVQAYMFWVSQHILIRFSFLFKWKLEALLSSIPFSFFELVLRWDFHRHSLSSARSHQLPSTKSAQQGKMAGAVGFAVIELENKELFVCHCFSLRYWNVFYQWQWVVEHGERKRREKDPQKRLVSSIKAWLFCLPWAWANCSLVQGVSRKQTLELISSACKIQCLCPNHKHFTSTPPATKHNSSYPLWLSKFFTDISRFHIIITALCYYSPFFNKNETLMLLWPRCIFYL